MRASWQRVKLVVELNRTIRMPALDCCVGDTELNGKQCSRDGQ